MEDRGEIPMQEFVKTAIYSAFGMQGSSLDGIQLVYPQAQVTIRDLDSIIPVWIKDQPCRFAAPDGAESDDDSSDEEIDVEEGSNPEESSKIKRKFPRSRYRSPGSVLDMLADPKATRRQIINGL